MNLRFVAIDVETANPDASSICQVGAIQITTDGVAGQWKSYVDPRDWFCGFNVGIHGIDETIVAGAPDFRIVAEWLMPLLEDEIVVTHTHFDRVAINRACENNGVPLPRCVWLDSARVARRAWPQFAKRGYGLANICESIGHEFQHHDALEDAIAAAHVMIAAMAETKLDITDWIGRVERPITPKCLSRATREGDPYGHLFGEVAVFTGALSLSRSESSKMAAKAGCQVTASVTKKTTLLVVGDQDVTRLAGHQKSAKHRKAEALAAKGQALRIMRESDFLQLCGLAA